MFFFFFFSSRRRHTRCSRDWSSDVCSSDLSYYVESLTNELEAAAWAYLDEIESLGGTLAAIERGFQQREIQEAAYRVQRSEERRVGKECRSGWAPYH